MANRKGIQLCKVSECADHFANYEGDNPISGFGMRLHVKTEVSELTRDDEGNIIIKTTPKEYDEDFYSEDEFRLFLMQYYDFKFIGIQYGFGAMSNLSTLWARFMDHNRDNFSRMYSDMLYEYNPIYNYDRNELHVYNTKDDGDLQKSGSEVHTISETGSITRKSTSSMADSGTTYYGTPGTGSEAKYDLQDNGSFKGDSSVSWGSAGDLTTTNFVNADDDDTGTAPARATSSTSQAGAVGTGTTGSAATLEYEDRSGLGHTDSVAYYDVDEEGNPVNYRKDTTSDTHTGQDSVRAVGNIGVTTSTAMVEEDIKFRARTNVISMIYEQFAKENFFIMGDDDDED